VPWHPPGAQQAAWQHAAQAQQEMQQFRRSHRDGPGMGRYKCNVLGCCALLPVQAVVGDHACVLSSSSNL
jgi:hypothetical protein